MATFGDILGLAVVYHCVTYIFDVGVRPMVALRRAQEAAARRGKPLLNVGSGTPGSSFRYVVFGPTTHWGHVNCDLQAQGACPVLPAPTGFQAKGSRLEVAPYGARPGGHRVDGQPGIPHSGLPPPGFKTEGWQQPGSPPRDPCHCDAQRLPFTDKEFGAVIASHVLEHVEDPEAAMAELHRVADEVFAVMPRWWSTTTWLHPGHRWYYDSRGRWHPLWGHQVAATQREAASRTPALPPADGGALQARRRF